MSTDKLIQCMKKEHVDDLAKIYKKSHDVIDLDIRLEDCTEKMATLHYAAKMGYALALEKLISLNADIHKTTQFDLFTPLHLACSCPDEVKSLRIVLELLERGADLSVGNYCERTPLIIGSEIGHTQVVSLLCNQGAFLDEMFGEEEYPHNISKAVNQDQQTDHLLDLEEIADAFLGNTSLIHACRQHHIGVIEELLQHDYDLNIPNAMGNTPLQVECLSYSRTAFDPQQRDCRAVTSAEMCSGCKERSRTDTTHVNHSWHDTSPCSRHPSILSDNGKHHGSGHVVLSPMKVRLE